MNAAFAEAVWIRAVSGQI